MASIAQNRAISYFKGQRHNGVFSGMQTNIAPSKYLQAVLASEGESFSKIIILCTKEVREIDYDFLGGITTAEYYIQQITDHARELGVNLSPDVFSVVPYDTTEADNVEDILKPILEIIKFTSDNENQNAGRLYIDFTGGMRTAAMTLVFAARYLAAKGVELANIVYANIVREPDFDGSDAEHPAPIEECIRTYETFDYFAALVEQKISGSTHGLLAYAKKAGKVEHAKILQQVTKAIDTKNEGLDTGKIENAPEDLGGILLGDSITKGILRANAGRWEQINTAVKERQATRALNLLKEHAMEILSKSGMLEYVGHVKEHNGFEELLSGYKWYYRKYIEFAKSLLRHLNSTKKSPVLEGENFASERYRLSFYKKKNVGTAFLTTFMKNHFDEKYALAIQKAQDSMVNEITGFINDGADVVTKIIQRTDEYSTEMQQHKNVYYSIGFPFAFVIRTNKNNPWTQQLLLEYPQLYRNALNESLRDLDGLYEKGECTPHTQRLEKVFDILGKQTCSYNELLRLLIKGNSVAEQAVRALFPLKYDTKNYTSRILTMPHQIEEFLQEFMPRYIDIRENRNHIMYAKMAPDEVDFALGKVSECLSMIRSKVDII